jgi:hypothetical protein
MTMEIEIWLIVLLCASVAWGAVRLFQYGLLYGRHWNYQEKTNDAPTQPSTKPAKAINQNRPTMGTWNQPEAQVESDFRANMPNPFAEPAIGGKDAIPPSPES